LRETEGVDEKEIVVVNIGLGLGTSLMGAALSEE
jgi:hypothetical protein